MIGYQEAFIDTLDEKKKEKLGLDEYPKFEFRNFTSKEELYTYIQKPEYLTNDSNKGVCYGFEIKKTSDGYEANLFFNDQSTMGGQDSIGIPN